MGIICAFTSVHIYAWVERRGWGNQDAGRSAADSCGVLLCIDSGYHRYDGILPYQYHLRSDGDKRVQIIFEFLQTPLLNLGDTLGAMVIAYIFLHFFWFFGVNGGSVVGAVFNPILQTLSLENMEFFKTGIGEGHIICQQFQDLFATLEAQAPPCP